MTFKQKIMAVAAFDEQREWLLLADAMKKFGHDAIKSYPAAKVGAFAERGRLTPLITRLVDEVEALKAALEQYKTEPLTVRNQYERDWSDPLPPPTNQITTGPMYSRRYVANEALIAHQKRWEDLK